MTSEAVGNSDPPPQSGQPGESDVARWIAGELGWTPELPREQQWEQLWRTLDYSDWTLTPQEHEATLAWGAPGMLEAATRERIERWQCDRLREDVAEFGLRFVSLTPVARLTRGQELQERCAGDQGCRRGLEQLLQLEFPTAADISTRPESVRRLAAIFCCLAATSAHDFPDQVLDQWRELQKDPQECLRSLIVLVEEYPAICLLSPDFQEHVVRWIVFRYPAVWEGAGYLIRLALDADSRLGCFKHDAVITEQVDEEVLRLTPLTWLKIIFGFSVFFLACYLLVLFAAWYERPPRQSYQKDGNVYATMPEVLKEYLFEPPRKRSLATLKKLERLLLIGHQRLQATSPDGPGFGPELQQIREEIHELEHALKVQQDRPLPPELPAGPFTAEELQRLEEIELQQYSDEYRLQHLADE